MKIRNIKGRNPDDYLRVTRFTNDGRKVESYFIRKSDDQDGPLSPEEHVSQPEEREKKHAP